MQEVCNLPTNSRNPIAMLLLTDIAACRRRIAENQIGLILQLDLRLLGMIATQHVALSSADLNRHDIGQIASRLPCHQQTILSRMSCNLPMVKSDSESDPVRPCCIAGLRPAPKVATQIETTRGEMGSSYHRPKFSLSRNAIHDSSSARSANSRPGSKINTISPTMPRIPSAPSCREYPLACA